MILTLKTTLPFDDKGFCRGPCVNDDIEGLAGGGWLCNIITQAGRILEFK
jgi:hypothetical protein